MEAVKKLLEIRKLMASKKPDFIRQDIHKKARLGRKWRKPRGLDSKIRRKFRGRAMPVSQGYRSPKKVRGLHNSGLRKFIVTAMADLNKLDPKENCLIIAASLGNKKKIEILKKAKEKNFEVVNIKYPESYIEKIEGGINLRKNAKQDAKEKQKTAKTEKKGSKEDSDKDKKEIERKEKDKLLTKREI